MTHDDLKRIAKHAITRGTPHTWCFVIALLLRLDSGFARGIAHGLVHVDLGARRSTLCDATAN